MTKVIPRSRRNSVRMYDRQEAWKLRNVWSVLINYCFFRQHNVELYAVCKDITLACSFFASWYELVAYIRVKSIFWTYEWMDIIWKMDVISIINSVYHCHFICAALLSRPVISHVWPSGVRKYTVSQKHPTFGLLYYNFDIREQILICLAEILPIK